MADTLERQQAIERAMGALRRLSRVIDRAHTHLASGDTVEAAHRMHEASIELASLSETIREVGSE